MKRARPATRPPLTRGSAADTVCRMRRYTTAIAAALVLVLAGALATLVTGLRSHPTGGLPAVAEAAWRSQNEYLVSGTATPAPAYAAWFESERPWLDHRRADLGGTRPRYIWQRTELAEVRKVFAWRDRARLTVRIESTLGMAGVEGTPPYTGSNEELEFHFRWVGGAWVLREVRGFGNG